MRRSLLLAVMLAGCAGVAPLGIHDTRLSRDARGLIADAEDALVVTRARRADALERLAEAQRQATRGSDLGGEAAAARSAMDMHRVALGRAEVGLADAELALARARLTQTYAEAAMRHDLAVYELAPLEAETEQRRKLAQVARARHHELRLQLEEATTRWWTAYRAFVQGGGDASKPWDATQ